MNASSKLMAEGRIEDIYPILAHKSIFVLNRENSLEFMFALCSYRRHGKDAPMPEPIKSPRLPHPLTPESLRGLMRQPAYSNPRDSRFPTYQRLVKRGFEILYPGYGVAAQK